MNYGPNTDPMENLKPDIGNISVYARHRDYHKLLRKVKNLAVGLLLILGKTTINLM